MHAPQIPHAFEQLPGDTVGPVSVWYLVSRLPIRPPPLDGLLEHTCRCTHSAATHASWLE